MDGKSDVVKNAMETARDAIGTRNTTIEGLALSVVLKQRKLILMKWSMRPNS